MPQTLSYSASMTPTTWFSLMATSLSSIPVRQRARAWQDPSGSLTQASRQNGYTVLGFEAVNGILEAVSGVYCVFGWCPTFTTIFMADTWLDLEIM